MPDPTKTLSADQIVGTLRPIPSRMLYAPRPLALNDEIRDFLADRLDALCKDVVNGRL